MTIDILKGYLVISRENGFLHIFLSRNATPWHHSRVSLWGRRRYNRYANWVDSRCVCDTCKATAPDGGKAHSADCAIALNGRHGWPQERRHPGQPHCPLR
jgi:hypothetical protein